MDERATLKDKGLQDEFDALFALFATPGWKLLMAEAGRAAAAVADIRRLQNTEDLHLAKGQLSTLSWLLSYESITEAGYKAALENDAIVDLGETDVDEA